MTSTQIKEQIEAIEKVTKEAAKSKESALAFLISAGIVKEPKKTTKGKK